MQGYIKIHRKIQECWLWQDKFSKGQAWIDLLLRANHKDNKICINGELINIPRGTFFTSIEKLKEAWKWDRKTVMSFLTLLENDNMIVQERTPKGTTLTIVNYEVYQDNSFSLDTQTDNTMDRGMDNRTDIKTDIKTDTNNNDNNIKNDNNIIKKKNNKKKKLPPYSDEFEEFWKIYPRKTDKGSAYEQYLARLDDGCTHDEMLKGAKGYASECEKLKTETQYIKHGSTFLSYKKPFLDYIDKKEEEKKDENGIPEDISRRIAQLKKQGYTDEQLKLVADFKPYLS